MNRNSSLTPLQVGAGSGRGSGVDILGRGMYRNGSQGHVLGRMRGPRGGSSAGLGGGRRSGGGWRSLPPGPPPTQAPPTAPPIPTAASAAAAYPGILLHFL